MKKIVISIFMTITMLMVTALPAFAEETGHPLFKPMTGRRSSIMKTEVSSLFHPRELSKPKVLPVPPQKL